MMFKKLFKAALVVGLSVFWICSASAQSGGQRYQPYGFCSSSSLSSAIGISSFTGTNCTNGNYVNAQYILVCAYTSGIVWRDDGTAPTSTPGTGGNGLSAGSCFPYYGTPSAIQFIQQTSGAIVGLSLYK